MSLETNDLLALKSLSKDSSMTPYEQFKVGHYQSKRPSGVAIAGLAVGVGAAVLAIGAAAWAGAKAKSAKEVAHAENDGLKDLIRSLATTVAAERSERINGDQTITQTITDTVSGSQQSSLTAQQAADLSAVTTVMQQTFSDAITGRSSLNATPVQLYSAPKPCGCPGGCGD